MEYIFYFFNKCCKLLKNNIFGGLGYILRNVEVLLCIRKKPYKTHTFRKNSGYYDYYHNKLKFIKPYY